MPDKELPFMPYLQKHKVYARQNRSHPTYAEKIVRKVMLSGRPLSYKFTRQKPLWPYIADFYCSALKLVIEIDGSVHLGNEDYDQIRDAYLQELGIVTIRYSNDAVIHEGNAVFADICAQMERRAQELALISRSWMM